MTWSSPDGITRYTQGPDCDSGPGCCCGKCTFINIAVDCGNTVCCKCVPKWLCMIFIPNEDQEDCMVREVTVPYTNSWQGSLPGIDTEGSNHLIEVLMFQEEDGPCMFRVYIPAREITDDYVIDGGVRECSLYPAFRQTCRDPYFQYDDFVLNGCTGTLIIKRKELVKVPFHSSREGLETSTIEMPEEACGTCSEYCRVLCMEWTVGGETQKSEFRINEGEAVWSHRIPDGPLATISLEEIDGVCHFVIDHDGLGVFDKIPIPYWMCNLGMVIEHEGTIEGAVGKFVSISCNRCTCWDYICETCRCVCQTMCVVSVDGPEQTDVTYYELEWDPVLIRWGTEEKWVGIRANPTTGKCEYVISGWNDAESDASEIDTEASTITIAECGKDMFYYVTSDQDVAFETGIFRFEYAVCKTCNPDCFKHFCDDCCGDCDSPELPEMLFFDLVGSAVAGDPPGLPPCLAIYDIPLIHTMPLFAESHRWEGHVIADCTTAFEIPPGPNATRIDILIVCSGDLWTITVRTRGEAAGATSQDVVNSNDPIKTSSFACSPVAWTGAFTSDLITVGCCSGVFEFQFAVSQ